jgi:molybdopterin/thiamine biosynthesis adenylyltransferase
MQAVSNIARYDRQNMIEGWDQEKLEKARIGIVGSGSLAQLTALPLAALGFGHIEIYDVSKVGKRSREDFLCNRVRKGSDKTKSLESILKKVNPTVDVRGISLCLYQESQQDIFNSLDLVIDCTNDPYSKLVALEYGQSTGTPVISAASSADIGELVVSRGQFDESYLFSGYKDAAQKVSTGMVIGGLIADEARKLIMPLKDKPIDRVISYNRKSKKRTGYEQDIELNPKKYLSDMHVVLIGAGALGNFVGLGLAIQGVGRLSVFDDDVVEETNLNRQVLFYDAVGRHKAEALVEKLTEINSGIDYEVYKRRAGKSFGRFLKDEKPALVIDCVDNFKTRALLNYFARTMQVPLIGGGTDFKSGQATVYVPGKTSCFQCQLAIDDLALKSYRPQSCIYAAEPSVVISNQVVGGFIINEVRTVLSPHIHGEPVQGVLKYNSSDKARIGMIGARKPCDCHTKPKEFYKEWTKKMNKLYDKGG